jgi:hypothetical protein
VITTANLSAPMKIGLPYRSMYVLPLRSSQVQYVTNPAATTVTAELITGLVLKWEGGIDDSSDEPTGDSYPRILALFKWAEQQPEMILDFRVVPFLKVPL